MGPAVAAAIGSFVAERYRCQASVTRRDGIPTKGPRFEVRNPVPDGFQPFKVIEGRWQDGGGLKSRGMLV